MLLILLGCCDLVHGRLHWVTLLGNFDKLIMEFTVQGRRHVLRGTSSKGLCTVKKQQLHRTLSKGVLHLTMLQVCYIDTSLLESMATHATQQPIPLVISQLLDEFKDFFKNPRNFLLPGLIIITEFAYLLESSSSSLHFQI